MTKEELIKALEPYTDKLYIAFGVKTITVKSIKYSDMFSGENEHLHHDEHIDEDFFFMCENKQNLFEKLKKLKQSCLVKEVRIYTVPIFSRIVSVEEEKSI